MKLKKYLSGIALTSIALSCAAIANQHQAHVDLGSLKESGSAAASAPQATTRTFNSYIVQMKAAPAVTKAAEMGVMMPKSQLVSNTGNRYNAQSALVANYVNSVKASQQQLAADFGITDVAYNYVHTFNGFSARLTSSQVAALESHPDVAAVYRDELHQLQTANTPAFLGLTGEGGQHTLGIKGEDVIVGVLDSGAWPENPSFGEDPSVPEWQYGPAPDGWNGECNVGSVGSFTDSEGNVVYDDETAPANDFPCNNKLIGARYFGSTFSSQLEIRFGLGEFASPRDADGHGSHTASTAAGNEGVTAVLNGVEVGTVSGIAPRARVAVYKVCWNADFVNENGDPERGCFFGDSMAAIDQAVVDGVDVLNYSIGNSNNINTPVYMASLRALDAGVFFASSAGNSGPTAATVSNIAPWQASVAASTYDGESAIVGNVLSINTGDFAETELFSIHSSIGTEIPADGFTGVLGTADPLLACDPLTVDLTGQIALIARGACAFVDKMQNAEAAGAIGVVVFTDNRTPIAMGGTDPGIGIPGVMVTNADGNLLLEAVASGSTEVTMTYDPASGEATEVGNIMAGFSSRGVNTQTGDMIKPDITAPGVRILAASTPQPFNLPADSGSDFLYLQGTSMSSPHIAGMAALLSGQYPEWTPAQIKSALMTTARQDVVKENGTTPADPFDFGAGHAVPVSAMTPGVVYSANLDDFLGFLCGQGEAGAVSGFDSDCATLAGNGVPTDASQLNYPSIAIAELENPETITRTVTDVTGEDSMYNVVVDAPAGINASVTVLDGDGNPVEGTMLSVPANGEATYQITFSRGEDFTAGTFVFGSVSLVGDNGITARSPVAINPVASSTMDVTEAVSVTLRRGRASFVPARTFYTGNITAEPAGLTLGFASNESANNGINGEFDFNTNVANASFWLTFEGTQVARYSIVGASVTDPDADLDLRIYTCTDFSCSPIGSSVTPGTSDETVVLVNPEPKLGSGDLYIAFVTNNNPNATADVDYQLRLWFADTDETSTRMTMSRRAYDGRFHRASIRTRGLESGVYMGAVSMFDANGEFQGTTVIEAVQP